MAIGLTGSQYRLPSEAEWEYAARAGSKDAYSFGAAQDKLAEYAHFGSKEGALKVGQKKPNAFGLFDMHGNVWEWTLDAFTPEGYKALKGPIARTLDAVQWPTTAYPRAMRGGGWQDGPEKLRSASRLGSDDEEWKSEDPNIPLSPWWYTTDPARSVGFRLLRSARPMEKDAMQKFWQYDCDDIRLDVSSRLEEGRGAEGLAVPELVNEIKKSQ